MDRNKRKNEVGVKEWKCRVNKRRIEMEDRKLQMTCVFQSHQSFKDKMLWKKHVSCLD